MVIICGCIGCSKKDGFTKVYNTKRYTKIGVEGSSKDTYARVTEGSVINQEKSLTLSKELDIILKETQGMGIPRNIIINETLQTFCPGGCDYDTVKS